MSFAVARKVADAVLYEGYVLYPYRASAMKNQVRWQFGVVVPRGYAQDGGSEPWAMQTECLVEPSAAAAALDIRIRFLQVQARTVEEPVDARGEAFRPVEMLEVEGRPLVTWDEGIERELEGTAISLVDVAAERVIPLDVPGGREVELVRGPAGEIRGRIVRVRWPISGVVRVTTEVVGNFVKTRVRIENLTAWSPGAEPGRGRDVALRQSLVGAHTLLAARDGAFVSLLDPPERARDAVASCVNLHTWPVLVGEPGRHDVMLSSPIILYDYPAVAPESSGDLCDATEIDEILTLRTMTLTDEEKREARGTDERAAAILERVDLMPPEILGRLHGAIRQLHDTTAQRETGGKLAWWDPSADASVSPATDSVRVGGVLVSKGSRVRLRPGPRRADAQDMFLAGRLGTVEGVFFDVENGEYVAVTLQDDPAADLHRSSGRFFYFSPDEVEPLDGEAVMEMGIEVGKPLDG